MNRSNLTGHAAIEYAEKRGLNLCSYASAVEGAREGLTPEQARVIAAEDPCLVYLDGMTDDAEATPAAITVELDSPVGPRAVVHGEADLTEIEAALPAGWVVSETPAVKTDTGGWSYPLVQTAQGATVPWRPVAQREEDSRRSS